MSASKNQFFISKFFCQKLRWKKFLWNWKIELATNAEYDSAWSADHKKQYLRPSKNQFLRWKFFGRKLKWKKFPWNWKIELAKNAEYDSAWCANHEKLYLSPSENQFLWSKFFLSEVWVKKIPLKLENRIRYKCRIWLSVIRWSRKTIFEPNKKLIFKIEIFSSEV